jgi:hypothetical protein
LPVTDIPLSVDFAEDTDSTEISKGDDKPAAGFGRQSGNALRPSFKAARIKRIPSRVLLQGWDASRESTSVNSRI